MIYVLVLIACMTLNVRTACQEFPRPHAFKSEQSCLRASALEEGRYSRRQARRNWMHYRWSCRDNPPDATPFRHNRGRTAP